MWLVVGGHYSTITFARHYSLVTKHYQSPYLYLAVRIPPKLTPQIACVRGSVTSLVLAINGVCNLVSYFFFYIILSSSNKNIIAVGLSLSASLSPLSEFGYPITFYTP